MTMPDHPFSPCPSHPGPGATWIDRGGEVTCAICGYLIERRAPVIHTDPCPYCRGRGVGQGRPVRTGYTYDGDRWGYEWEDGEDRECYHCQGSGLKFEEVKK
jgi:hypothetical protein